MNKNFLETAISNQTGLWNGYAFVPTKHGISLNIMSVTRLLGFNTRESCRKSLFEKTSPHYASSIYLSKVPDSINRIIVTDNNLEFSYGSIERNSLNKVHQLTIVSREKPGVFHEISDLQLIFYFKIKPSIKLEERVFHFIEISLKFINGDDYVPQFKFGIGVPQCFVSESLKNPNFVKEIMTKLCF